jgi:hypothetical protein
MWSAEKMETWAAHDIGHTSGKHWSDIEPRRSAQRNAKIQATPWNINIAANEQTSVAEQQQQRQSSCTRRIATSHIPTNNH